MIVRITDHLFVNTDNVVSVLDDLTKDGEPVPGTFIDMIGGFRVGVVGKTLSEVTRMLGYTGVDLV